MKELTKAQKKAWAIQEAEKAISKEQIENRIASSLKSIEFCKQANRSTETYDILISLLNEKLEAI